MTNEELILERLDRLERSLAPVIQSSRMVQELRDDLMPRVNELARQMVVELSDVEAAFQLEDLLELGKRFLRSVRSLNWVMVQLENLVDFMTTVEPLMRTSVPRIIQRLDELETKGVFRLGRTLQEALTEMASSCTPQELEQVGQGLVVMMKLARALSDPRTVEFLEKLAALPAEVDLSQARGVGPLGMLGACSCSEVKEGLGVMLELTKAMGKLKS